MRNRPDFYTILGIPRNASLEEIHRAYLQAARQLHPDRNSAPGDTELFLGAQEAYETLSNPKKRAKYDSTLPPEAEAYSPIKQNYLLSRHSLLKLEEPQILYLLMEFAVPAGEKNQSAPPLNLC